MPSNVEYVSLGRVRIGDFGYSYGYGRARLLFFNTDRRADLAVALAEVANSDTACRSQNSPLTRDACRKHSEFPASVSADAEP